jgi:hypothetical protein
MKVQVAAMVPHFLFHRKIFTALWREMKDIPAGSDAVQPAPGMNFNATPLLQ